LHLGSLSSLSSLLVIFAAPVGTAQSRRDWSAAARPRRAKRCCLIENNAALRHNFDRERIAQFETKEVEFFGLSCRLAVMAPFGASTETSEDAVSLSDRYSRDGPWAANRVIVSLRSVHSTTNKNS
jgi:hypothetical protein